MINGFRLNSRINNVYGAVLGIIAVFLFSIVFISGRLVDNNATAVQILWFRYFGGLITVISIVVLKGFSLSELKTDKINQHFVRALAGGLGTAAGIYAATYLPIASATAIGLMDGVLTVIFAVLLLRERLSLIQWLSCMVCVVAAQIVVFHSGPVSHNGALDPVALMVAAFGAVSLAVENICIKRLTQSDKAIRVLFYVNLFGIGIFFLPALWLGIWDAPGTLALLLLLGPVAVLGQFCNIRAFGMADAAIVAPMRYSWIIFAAIWGALWFGEIPGPIFYIGSCVVLAAGVRLALTR